jgi:hypothetical protein
MRFWETNVFWDAKLDTTYTPLDRDCLAYRESSLFVTATNALGIDQDQILVRVQKGDLVSK